MNLETIEKLIETKKQELSVLYLYQEKSERIILSIKCMQNNDMLMDIETIIKRHKSNDVVIDNEMVQIPAPKPISNTAVATVDNIVVAGNAVAGNAVASIKKRGRPFGSKNKPKVKKDDVAIKVDNIVIKPISDVIEIDIIKPVDNVVKIDMIKPTEIVKPVDVVKPIDMIKPVDNVVKIDMIKPTEIVKPIDVVKPIKFTIKPFPHIKKYNNEFKEYITQKENKTRYFNKYVCEDDDIKMYNGYQGKT